MAVTAGKQVSFENKVKTPTVRAFGRGLAALAATRCLGGTVSIQGAAKGPRWALEGPSSYPRLPDPGPAFWFPVTRAEAAWRLRFARSVVLVGGTEERGAHRLREARARQRAV